jgi:hypothetical protein
VIRYTIEQKNVPLAALVESFATLKNPAEAGTLNAVFETMPSFPDNLSPLPQSFTTLRLNPRK